MTEETTEKRHSRLAEGITLVIWCVGTLLSEDLPVAVSLFLAIALHECGHLMAYLLVGMPMPRLKVNGLGLRLSSPHALSFKAQCIVALAGPCMNLLTALLLIGLYGFTLPAALHILTAVGNLMPVATLDGGRVLESVLAFFLSPRLTYAVTRVVSLCTILPGIMATLACLWVRGQGSYLFFLCFSLLLLHIFGSRQTQKEHTDLLSVPVSLS